MLEVKKYQNGCVDIAAIEEAMQKCFSVRGIVGDKYPAYLFMLHNLADIDDLVRLVIFRDCRDVVSSVLERVQTRWRNRSWITNFDTAE